MRDVDTTPIPGDSFGDRFGEFLQHQGGLRATISDVVLTIPVLKTRYPHTKRPNRLPKPILDTGKWFVSLIHMPCRCNKHPALPNQHFLVILAQFRPQLLQKGNVFALKSRNPLLKYRNYASMEFREILDFRSRGADCIYEIHTLIT